MKGHLVASVHHAAKADAYGKLGYRQQQREHAARALEHTYKFGGDDEDWDDDDWDDDSDDEDVGEVMSMLRQREGSLIPRSMLRRAPVARSTIRRDLADGTDRKRIVSAPSANVTTWRVPAGMPPVWRDLLNRQGREFAKSEARRIREWPELEWIDVERP
jgi:hypothetical protein